MTKESIIKYIREIRNFGLDNGKQREFQEKLYSYLKEKKITKYYLREYFSKDYLLDFLECTINACYDTYNECI
ncbi:MAG: hypothetical protein RR500_04825 [Bacilli bacterium]